MKKKLTIILILALIMAFIPAASNFDCILSLFQSNFWGTAEDQAVSVSVISDTKDSGYTVSENVTFIDKQSGNETSRSAKSVIYSLVGAVAAEDFCEDEVKALAVAYHTQLCREALNGTLCIDTSDSTVYLSESDLKSKFGDGYTTFCSYCDNVYSSLILADGEPINLNLTAISSSNEKNSDILITANPYCSLSGDYMTEISFDTDKFCEIVSSIDSGINTQTAPQQMVGDITYSADGSVESVIIGGVTLSGDTVVNAFGLPYGRFTLVYSLEEFQFSVMQSDVTDCLVPNAAHFMAEQGNTFEEIINYFY